MDLVSKALHYIGKNMQDVFVVQIGAMDGINFDDTRGFLDLYNWQALLVEPIPEIFSELISNFKDKKNYIFEQSAICEYDGKVLMLTIPVSSIEKENLHPGYKGMSAIYPFKNGFGSDYQRDLEVKENFGVNIEVPCLTFTSLLKKHNIEKFDILICDVEGYDYSVLKQIDFDKYKPAFLRFEYINLTKEEKSNTEKILKAAGYTIEVSGQDIDAVRNDLWEKIKESDKNPNHENEVKSILSKINALDSEKYKELVRIMNMEKEKIVNEKLTVVTGLWNIGRSGRDFSHYIENFQKLLEIESNLFVYIPKEYEYLVWEKRSKENTFVKVYELEDVKNLYRPFWDKTQQIRANLEWYDQTGENGWLKNSPQASLEYYNPIVQSKMFLLHDVTIWNPFNTDYFIWLDAGITNTVPFGYVNECLKNMTQSLNPFLFLSYPYETETEIHGFKKADMDRYANADVKYVCRGGLFGGHKDTIHRANGEYYALLSNTLSEGLMGTEESIFTIMSYLDPHTYRRYELDGNGLIVKFAADKNPELVPIDKEKKIVTQSYLDSLKVSVYMLTFNFPHQVEHTIKKWLKHDKWLIKTKNILIDNSTTDQAREENKKLCEKYNFEHIVTNENLGINGGRFLAAQHFQESDSDYYIFIEDDMGIHPPESNNKFCRNGFRLYVPNLYDRVLKILETSDVDFLKLSFTEVYMDNNLQVSWYNVPQTVRTEVWPDYDKLPVTGLDPNCPRTKFDKIEVVDGLAYITGEVYYANWPTICGKKGNQKMFLDTTWARPYEQTWMSYIFQETKNGNMKPAVLLASPIDHDRIAHYAAEERREN